MSIITATNPAELRQEAERLLREGDPMAPVVIDAITDTGPDAPLFQECDKSNLQRTARNGSKRRCEGNRLDLFTRPSDLSGSYGTLRPVGLGPGS